MPAPFVVDIDPRQLRAAQQRLSPAPFERVMRAGMNEATQYLKGEVQQLMPVNNGLARGSVFTDVRGATLAGLYGITASPLEYVAVLEYGRRPGAPPPPVAAIQAWAARKLGDGSRGTAYVIARAIGRRGLPAHHMFSEAARRGLVTIGRIFTRHLRGL